MQALWLPIDQLRFTAKKRRGVSPKRVEELRQALEDGDDIRPIRVHALGDGTYIVKDGRHRIQAHCAAGLASIAAFVENLRERMRTWFALLTHPPKACLRRQADVFSCAAKRGRAIVPEDVFRSKSCR